MTRRVSIIVGSVLGATEYVADAIEAYLQDNNYQVTVFLNPELDDIPVESTWLVCTSTHGAGDLPDNIQPFAKQLESANLAQVTARIIGLGDSSYDTFCYGAATMKTLLKNAGCNIDRPVHTIDVLQHPVPEDDALEWVKTCF